MYMYTYVLLNAGLLSSGTRDAYARSMHGYMDVDTACAMCTCSQPCKLMCFHCDPVMRLDNCQVTVQPYRPANYG